MLKILQAILQQYMNQELQDVQIGVRKGRRTRDQTANMCWIIEEARTATPQTPGKSQSQKANQNDHMDRGLCNSKMP